MQADDPAYLSVGTAVSAKYKGAFCEAKVSKVVRIVKCKVTYKMGLGTATVSDEQIKGTLRVGHTVQAKHSEKKEFVEATITKIQDCSQYTVVFDDGDITTLRRSALCLKSGRHFNESETLDQLPLTHPEHFGNPVVGGRRGRRNRQLRDDSSEGEPEEENEPDLEGYSIDIGRVVSVEATDKKRGKDNWFPGLVVIPSAQPTVRINVKDEYLVRSFKDGRYYTVPKKEVTEFNRDSGEKVESAALEEAVNKAIKYLDNNELPVHWERNSLFNMQSIDSDSDENYSSSDDEPNEEKDRFVAQLYKFMDDSGTPLNKTPLIANKDVDLHRMFRVVQKLGGYNRVTNKNKWRLVTTRLKLPNNQVTYNQVKNVYKKCLSSYETFYKTLGVTMLNHNLTTKKNRGRSLIRDKDRATPVSSSPKPEKEEDVIEKKEEEKSSSDEKSKKKEKEPKKDEEKRRKEFVENSDTSTSSDATDQSESREGLKGRRDKKDKKKIVEKVKKEEDGGQQTRSKAQSKKELPIAKKEIKPVDSKPQKVQKKSDDDKKRGRKKIEEKASVEIITEAPVNIGDKLKVYYGPTHEHKVTYEAKVIDVDKDSTGLVYLVHYTGWNTRYDEWISPTRIAENLSANTKAKRLKQSAPSAKNAKSAKRGRGVTLANRGTATDATAAPPPRSTTPSSVTSSSSRTKSPATTRSMRNTRLDSHRKTRRASAHTDISNHSEESDSDGSGSESEVSARTTRSAEPRTYKRKIKKGKDEEDNEKRRTRKGAKKSPEKSEESDEDAISSLPKGRDFDLNQIRSELKGFNKAVKIPLDSSDKEASSSSSSEDVIPEPEEEEKKEIKSEDLSAEDIYEFKEPEPFEFEPRPKSEDKTAKKRIPRLFEMSPDQDSPELDKKRPKKEDDPFDKLAESPSYNLGRIAEAHDKTKTSFSSEEASTDIVNEEEESVFSKFSRNLGLEFDEDVKKENDSIREVSTISSDEENLTEDEDLEVKKKEDVVVKEESVITEEKVEAKCEEEKEEVKHFIHTHESSKLLETLCSKPLTCRVEESKELVKTGTRIADSLLQKFSSLKSKSEAEDSESEIEDPKVETEKEVENETPSVVEAEEIKCKPCVEPEIKKLSPIAAPPPKPEIESTKKKRKVVSRAYIDESDSNSSDSEQLVIARSDDDSQTNSTTEKTELKESDSETSPPNAATTDDSESQEQRNFKFDEPSEKSETLPEEPPDGVKEDEPDSQLHSLLLCEETIPRSPAPAPESGAATTSAATAPDKSKKTSLEMPFASAPGTCGSSVTKSILLGEHGKPAVAKVQPPPLVLPPMVVAREVSNVITPPSTPGSSTSSGDHGDFSPNTIENESCKSNDAEVDFPRKRRNSSVNKSLYSEDDTQTANESTSGKKSREESSLPATCRKRRKSTRGNDDVPPKRGRKPLNRSRHNSDSDDTSEHSLTGSASLALANYETRTAKSPRPLKYNFFVEFDPSLNSGQRIAVLQQKLSELRKTYAEVKAELAAVERRRKKIRRREREALKASKQELVCG